MSSHIVRPRNENDTAVNTAVMINANSFTTIVASNGDRLYARIQNPNTSTGIWVCLCPPGSATLETSIYLNDKMSSWEMPPDNMYVGDISAKNQKGNAKVIIIEY